MGGGRRHPRDQRAHLGRASLPGTRRRADDPPAARRARRRHASAWVGDGSNVLVSLASARGAHRHGGRRRVPGGLRAARGNAARARARPARGRAPAPTSLVTDIWVSLGQEAERERRLRDLEPYRLDESLVAPRRARASSSTACPRTPARRSLPTCSTARARPSGTRPRTASTCRKRYSRYSSRSPPGSAPERGGAPRRTELAGRDEAEQPVRLTGTGRRRSRGCSSALLRLPFPNAIAQRPSSTIGAPLAARTCPLVDVLVRERSAGRRRSARCRSCRRAGRRCRRRSSRAPARRPTGRLSGGVLVCPWEATSHDQGCRRQYFNEQSPPPERAVGLRGVLLGVGGDEEVGADRLDVERRPPFRDVRVLERQRRGG